MVAAWRRSTKEEKRSLLSSRHQGSSDKAPKKKGGLFAKTHEHTPPVTPADDDHDEDFMYDVAIVASEYDPSQSFGMSAPKPIARYPSTPMRRVEFKPEKAPPVFTPPPPLTEESVLASTRSVEEIPPPPPPGELPSLYTQTLKFIDDICQIPQPQDKGPGLATPQWGTAPSADENSTYGPSYQTSTEGGTEMFTEYSRSYMTSRGSGSERQAPKEDVIEHENYEVVLDVANLAASPPDIPQRKSRSALKPDTKASMVKRLFSGRKKDDFKDDVAQEETPQSPIYDDPEIQDDAAVIDYPELWLDPPEFPPVNHEREIAVTHVPPTAERALSPVEEVLNSIGNLFNYYKEEEKKEEPEMLVTPMGSLDEYVEEVGPEDEIEGNLTPNSSFAEGEDLSVHRTSSAVPQVETTVGKKAKAKRALSLGVLAKRMSMKKKSKKAKPLWLPAVDRKTGRTYWYNRITRESTYRRPAEAAEPEMQEDAPKPEPEKKLEPIVEGKEKSMEAATRGVDANKINTPLRSTKNERTPASPPKMTEQRESQRRVIATTPKKKNSKKTKPLWVAAVDRKTGRTYWYNHITRESTYNPPLESVEAETEVEAPMPQPKVEAAKPQLKVEVAKPQPNVEDAKPQPKAEAPMNVEVAKPQPKVEALNSQKKQGLVAATAETEESNEAPKKTPLWKSAVDPNSGRTYWYNRVTRESTYNPPPEAFEQEIDVEASKPQTKEDLEPVVATEMEKEDAKQPEPDVEVPKEPKEEPTPATLVSPDVVADTPKKKSKKPLWKAVVDKNSGRTYYYHRKTGETTWKMPQELNGLKEAEQSALTETDIATANRDAAKQAEDETPPLVVRAEVSEESMVRINKGEQGLLDNSYDREEAAEEHDAFDQGSIDENPFDEPIVNVGDIPMHRVSSPSRSATFLSKASATTKSSVKTDKTERIRNTGPLTTSKTFETISETMSSATSISSHHDELRLNTPERPSSLLRSRELKVEELTGSRVAAETYDRAGRVLYGKFDPSAEEAEAGSYYGDNEFGDDSVSALSENDGDFSQRKENFEQARRRALDDAIEREDWDLAAALSEGMRATTTTGDYTKAHKSWSQSELDKFIAANDWDAVKSYIARMREAKKAGREEVPPPITKSFSSASDPTVRVPTSSRNVASPPTISESASFPYEKRIGSRSQAQHDRIQQREESQDSDSSDSDDSTELSRSLDEETYDSEYS